MINQSGRLARIGQEKVDGVNNFLQIHPGSSVRSVAKASSIPHTIITYRIRTEHLLLSRRKCSLFNSDMRKIVLKCGCHYPLNTRTKTTFVFVRMRQQPFI